MIENKKIGVLSIQGSFAEHGKILTKLHVPFIFVRSKEKLQTITHLIIPGGESTTLTKLLHEYDMWNMLEEKIKSKLLQVFGTCAGTILCEKLGMDIKVDRNAYGAQQHSFSAELDSTLFPHLRGVFIRAPRFISNGESVKILVTHQQEPCLAEQENFLAASFHPELAGETRIHEYFLKK
ncbi:MAG: pyridoxal 5'-phosphate synthase glutaminase subunit PdxT [Candidatus Magasanikbacteria bacterium]